MFKQRSVHIDLPLKIQNIEAYQKAMLSLIPFSQKLGQVDIFPPVRLLNFFLTGN